MPQIVVNGKTYNSLDEMPPEMRLSYEQALKILGDKDQNGVPDAFERALGINTSDSQTTEIQANSTQFISDGKVYSSASELSPEARAKYEQAMAKLGPVLADANGNGTPDLLEGRIPQTPDITTPGLQPMVMDMPADASQNPPPSVISDVTPNYGAIAIIAIAALVIVGLLGLGVYMALPLLK